MKKFKKYFTPLLFTGVFLTALFSCKREVVPAPSTIPNESVKIDSMKVFLSNLINIKKDQIHYDTATRQFLVDGISQINFDELSIVYQNSKAKK